MRVLNTQPHRPPGCLYNCRSVQYTDVFLALYSVNTPRTLAGILNNNFTFPHTHFSQFRNTEKKLKTPHLHPTLSTHAHTGFFFLFKKGMISAIVSCCPTFSVLLQLRLKRPVSQTKALNLESAFSAEDLIPSCVFLVVLEPFLKRLMTEINKCLGLRSYRNIFSNFSVNKSGNMDLRGRCQI